jgi:hypothetical protein
MTSRTAFVIMQIGEKESHARKRADEVADYVIREVLEEHEFSLEMLRSDRDPTPGRITPQLLKSLIDSVVVIADLTGRNPNVYYELGVAHSFGRPVVALCDKSSSLAFDTKDERVIELGDSPILGVAQAEEAKKQLREALRRIFAPDYRPSSLVSEVAASQSLDRLAPSDPVASELAALREVVSTLKADFKSTAGGPIAVQEEINVMRNFIEKLLTRGTFRRDDLIEMSMDTGSSGNFDRWVRRAILEHAVIGTAAGPGRFVKHAQTDDQ